MMDDSQRDFEEHKFVHEISVFADGLALLWELYDILKARSSPGPVNGPVRGQGPFSRTNFLP